MDVLEALLPLILIVLLILGAKAVWMSGYVAGAMGEAKLWLDGIDKLIRPNWQNMPITADNMTPEQVKWMNQVYASCYELALVTIRDEIAASRREAVEKAKAQEEKQRQRFER